MINQNKIQEEKNKTTKSRNEGLGGFSGDFNVKGV